MITTKVNTIKNVFLYQMKHFLACFPLWKCSLLINQLSKRGSDLCVSFRGKVVKIKELDVREKTILLGFPLGVMTVLPHNA